MDAVSAGSGKHEYYSISVRFRVHASFRLFHFLLSSFPSCRSLLPSFLVIDALCVLAYVVLTMRCVVQSTESVADIFHVELGSVVALHKLCGQVCAKLYNALRERVCFPRPHPHPAPTPHPTPRPPRNTYSLPLLFCVWNSSLCISHFSWLSLAPTPKWSRYATLSAVRNRCVIFVEFVVPFG